MIYYLAPDLQIRSAGIRMLHRHVEILCRNGIPASILHDAKNFRITDMPNVPVRDMQTLGAIQAGDTVVVPEVLPQFLASFQNMPVNLIVIAMNWKYIYQHMEMGKDYRQYKVQRVITQSPHIAEYVQWAMGLPTSLYVWAVKGSLYYPEPEKKIKQVVFIDRKQYEMRELAALMHSRDPRYYNEITWRILTNLTETEYAAEIRRSQLFLNLSRAEGLPCSLFEAMRAGTLVAGYNSVGGQRELIGEGENQNCILAENLDYVTLAQRLEPLFKDILAGDMGRWEKIRANGFATSAPYTEEAEEASVVAMWRGIIAG